MGVSWIDRLLPLVYLSIFPDHRTIDGSYEKEWVPLVQKGTRKFCNPKAPLTTSWVLAFPNFSLHFVMETNACVIKIRAVLIQEEHPLAFFGKKLSGPC